MGCNNELYIAMVSMVASSMVHIHSWESHWVEGHLIVSLLVEARKVCLTTSNVILGGVGMSWVSHCDRPHDAF